MRPLNSFFYLFVNFCEVSRRGFSVTLSLSTGVQHFALTNPMTPAVPSSSVVRHRRCLLLLTRRASLPFIDTEAVFLFIYISRSSTCYQDLGALGLVSHVKSIQRERKNVFTLLNLVRFGQNESSRLTKLLSSLKLSPRPLASEGCILLLEVTGVRERSTFTLLHRAELLKRF